MSIVVNRRRINDFLENYNLGKLLSHKEIKTGLVNRVYLLKTTKGRYILKIAVRNNPVRVRYEAELLNYLKNLPVPKPIKSKNKRLLEDFGRNKAIIYKYLAGRQRSHYNFKMLEQVGSFLGKMHSQTINFKSKIKRVEYYNFSKAKLNQVFKKCYKNRDSKIKAALRYIKKTIPKYIIEDRLPTGAMHIDFKPENTLFIKNKFTGVLDFDNSYNGPLVFDLGHTMMFFCSKNKTFNLNQAKAIYYGYNKFRKLNQQEEKYLFEVLHFSYLSHFLGDIYNFKEDTLPKKYIYWMIDNLLKTQQNFKMSKDEFCKKLNL